MKKPILVCSLLSTLLVGTGWACDVDCSSYEKCINVVEGCTHGTIMEIPFEEANHYLMKAIAFKLDQIEKKLDKPNDEEYCPGHGPGKCEYGSRCIMGCIEPEDDLNPTPAREVE